MKKLLILLISILLIGCTDSKPEPSTAWDRADHTEINGIVEIATGWAKSHLCTGSLIREDMILTAAHCAVFPAEDLYIIYGCNDIDQSSCKRVRVKNVVRYPKYKKEFIAAHDIAILIPETPIPIKLAEISNRKVIAEGLSIKALGFGYRNDDSGVLYAGRGRVTSDYEYEMVAYMKGALDPNPGDSGGPALILDGEEFKVIGVLSRARWRGASKEETFVLSGYAIYTKPIMYLDWIYEVGYNEDCGISQ